MDVANKFDNKKSNAWGSLGPSGGTGCAAHGWAFYLKFRTYMGLFLTLILVDGYLF